MRARASVEAERSECHTADSAERMREVCTYPTPPVLVKRAGEHDDGAPEHRELTMAECADLPVRFELAGGNALRVQNAALSPWGEVTGAYSWHDAYPWYER